MNDQSTPFAERDPEELVRGLMRGNRSELKLGYDHGAAVIMTARIKGIKSDDPQLPELIAYAEGFGHGMSDLLGEEAPSSCSGSLNGLLGEEQKAWDRGFDDGSAEPRADINPAALRS